MCINMLHVCQVADLRRQLKEPKPRSRLGLASRHPSGPPKAEGTAPAASDELGHLHTQVEGVENTIAILRSVQPATDAQLQLFMICIKDKLSSAAEKHLCVPCIPSSQQCIQSAL